MIIKEPFGTLPDNTPVTAYTLSNSSILRARIIDFGGTVVNLWVKGKDGAEADVICGFDDINGYLNAKGYQGAIIGRVCNRISKSKFTLDGVEYILFANDGKNSAHGGEIGFNKRMWDVKVSDDADEPSLELTYTSPDMEENYPGTLRVKVIYTLKREGALSIHYIADTDKNTIVNLTNHAYFNLAGYDKGTMCDQVMWIDADRINDQDFELIPTGELVDVEKTPYDFRVEKPIGRDFDSQPSMDRQGGGYDNNYIINGADSVTVKKCASLYDKDSGRFMEVYTNQPCVQIYTSNMIDPEDLPFKNGVAQCKNCAVCFETQKMPDSINHTGFTDTVLKPGDVYDFTTVYAFSNK